MHDGWADARKARSATDELLTWIYRAQQWGRRAPRVGMEGVMRTGGA